MECQAERGLTSRQAGYHIPMHARKAPQDGKGCLGFLAAFVLLGLPPLLALIWLIWRTPKPPATPWPTALLTVEAPPTAVERSPTPPAPSTPPPAPTQVSLQPGMRVLVAETEGAGLNLRASPSLQAETLLIAEEGTPFVILQGPLEVDGFRWWRLQKADDPAITGWAVERYLRPAP